MLTMRRVTKAAGWIPLDQTQGFARVNRQDCDFYDPNGRPKAVWAKPLCSDALELLNARTLPEDCVGGAQGDARGVMPLGTEDEQVAALRGNLLGECEVEIDFAWRTFRRDNESFDKAHVHCVIIGFHCGMAACPQAAATASQRNFVSSGLRRVEDNAPYQRIIFDENGNRREEQNINPYLVDAPDAVIESRVGAICNVPRMTKGCYPSDGGSLILTQEERDARLV